MALRYTHLYEYHRLHGKLVDFSGFEMPVWFEGVIPEHNAVRNAVGIFDVSHMGRVLVVGGDAEAFVDSLVTNDVSKLVPMEALYTVACNERGGIEDDFTVYRLAEERLLIVPNAGNRVKDYAWLSSHSRGFGVELKDVSDDVAMVAVQGPRAEETLQKIASEPLSEIKRFKCREVALGGHTTLVARTGYTGEDGFEIYLWGAPLSSPVKALDLWEKILSAGKEFGIRPCGLGARDSLRLEAGLSLYGNDIDEETNPFEARLGFVVKLKKRRSFIGKEALVRINKDGPERRLVGMRIVDRGIPRHGYEIWKEGKQIGHVTSGGFSPTLDVGIALGYVAGEYAELGTEVEIKIRQRLARGIIVKSHPFYDETQYGYKREKR
jgi:aminomethyltransferase